MIFPGRTVMMAERVRTSVGQLPRAPPPLDTRDAMCSSRSTSRACVVLALSGCAARGAFGLALGARGARQQAARNHHFASATAPRLRRLAAFDAGSDDLPAPAEEDGGADPTLSPLLETAREAAMREDRRTAQNWREASWTNRGFRFHGVQIRCVQMRELADLSFGSEDGTVYGVDVGTERLADFVRMEAAEGAGADPRADIQGGTTLRDIQGGTAGLEMLVSGTTRTRIGAEYTGGHEGAVTALFSEGALLVSGGVDGKVCVWTNRAQRTGVPAAPAEADAKTNAEANGNGEEKPSLDEALAAMGAVVEKTEKRMPLKVFSTHSPFTTLGLPNDYCKPSAVVGLVQVETDEAATTTGTLVASASRDGLLQVWDTDALVPVGTPVAVLPSASQEEGINDNCGVTCMCALSELGCLVVGTEDGRVVLYAIDDLLATVPVTSGDAAAVDISTPAPLHVFEAHGGSAVTALFSGTGADGEVLPSSLPGGNSIVTGGANGEVKQFEVFRDGGGTLRHWPQLGSQKLQRRVHRIDAHEGAVTCLHADATKIISACAADGSIMGYKRSSGEEILRMACFDANLSTIAVSNAALVCDGMGETLCLHDFSEVDEELDAVLSHD